jgi:hypothetical protein
MKKIFTCFSLIVLANLALAQNGLENIIVEKYYISNANDTNANDVGGPLPVGSVTYRVYVDMAPGYNFQAAFGLKNQELRIETTTSFFNNIDYGSTSPTFSKNNSQKNTVMLDSWLSVGAACNGHFGVLKTDDDGANTNINSCSGCNVSQILQNNDTEAGIPISQQDGLLAGTPLTVTSVGISDIIGVFGSSTNGNLFNTQNGSWAALGGAVGPDPATNRVLIGQFTTDGTFSFRLNVQLGTPSGATERYVASNPASGDIEFSELIYDSSVLTNSRELKNSDFIYKMYPNPAKEYFTIEVKSKSKSKSLGNTLKIYSVEGAEVANLPINVTTESFVETINFSEFSTGIYFVQLNLDGVVTTKKIIKF